MTRAGVFGTDGMKRMAGAVAALFIVLATASVSGEALAIDKLEKGVPEAVTDIWAIARGGQLYDKWWAVMEADAPKTTHPAYPAAGKQKGAATWRCKECHGWDYKGKDGAYGKGSHFTGIKGISGATGLDANKLHDVIMDKTHGYTGTTIPHSAMEKLVLFIGRGQVDMDKYIDRQTKKARGNPSRGGALFQTVCAICHGFDGKTINFGDDKNPEYVGTVASENPWEALHKIRNGQPGVPMIALAALGDQDHVDILAYAQTLPQK